MNTPIPRRHFHQSTTAIIALPVLETLGFRRFASAASPATPPKRLVFLSFGYGVTEPTWYPDIKKCHSCLSPTVPPRHHAAS